MKKLPEVDVQNRAADFAGKYLDAHFKKGDDIARNIVLNSVAHGFWMGAKYFEKKSERSFLGIVFEKKWTDEELNEESIKAAKYYLRKGTKSKYDMGTASLVKACISHGFSNGLRWRELLERNGA